MGSKVFQRLLLSFTFSFVTWMIVDLVLITIPFWKCFIFEIFIVLMLKLYIFVCIKFDFINPPYGESDSHQ
jgi:hypothetical protein